MRVAQASQPERLAPTAPILGFLTSAGLAVAVLLWLILAGPGYLGYGTSLLWAGAPKSGILTLFTTSRSLPATGRCGAKPTNWSPRSCWVSMLRKVRLFAQYQGASKWEQVDMLPSPGASTYEFLFSSLADQCRVLRRGGRGSVQALQPARGRSAGDQENSRHLSLPGLDRDERLGGRSRRRPARRGRHRGRSRDSDRPPA